MSPEALVSELKSLGVDWFAITDHNSMANCPAYEAVAKKNGLAFSWGLEIQSLEEIHILAYFDDREKAQAFDALLYKSLFPLDNDPDFFGDQVIIDENENILRLEPRALINSSVWDLATVVEQVQAFDGLAIPAHIDASVNSVFSQLGFMPDYPVFEVLGITAGLNLQDFLQKHPELMQKAFIRASDAHYLSDLGKGSCIMNVNEPKISEILLSARRVDGRYIQN